QDPEQYIMSLSTTKKAILALIISNIIWGAAPPIFKWALMDIGPFTLGYLRFLLACLLLLPFCYKHLHIYKKDIPILFFCGFTAVTINIMFFFLGLRLAPSINVNIISSASPIALVFISHYFLLKEKFNKKALLGSYIAFAGVMLTIIKPLLEHGAGDGRVLVGNILFVISALGALGLPLFGKKIIKDYKPETLTFWTLFIGCVTFLPFFLNETITTNSLAHLTLRAVSGILYGALFSSLTAYGLFFWALKYLPATETEVFLYLDPVVTVLIAAPLLHEYPDAMFFAGAVLVFAGVYVAQGRIPYHPIHKLFKS
ncbi:MAG TPA: DMT family transporter, partial [Candidatus Saccharimonadales bacterium]|nr:DMT family transporter [Candidatus Saccharimonadales bacterium]